MIDRWFFRPAPASRLAVLRILTGVYAVSYLLIRFRVFFTMGDNIATVWDPSAPFGGWLVHFRVAPST